jgi:uncharacterized protein YcbK (DUF882 family)
MSAPSHLRQLKLAARILGPGVLVAGLTLAVFPAAAARWSDRDLAPTPLLPRVPSPAELALREGNTAPTLPPRDTLVAVENQNTREKAVFNIGPGGYVRSDQSAALDAFFSCRRTKKKNPIHPTVLALLADIAEHWPGRVIQILSGYRSPPYGVTHSRHFLGYAIDLRIPGVPTTEIRDFVWREHKGVGVGYYPQSDFVHIDSRAGAREAAWSAHQESARPDYNPHWATKARSPHARRL